MKAKKLLALVLTLAMIVSLFPAVYAAETDPLSFADAEVSYLKPHLDGEEITVKTYTDVYCASPNRPADQKIQISVPDNATANSPIILLVDNSGWRSDSFASHKGVKSYGVEEGFRGPTTVGDYSSTTSSIGVALSRGYIVVSLGARSRADGLTGEEYLGHSPATMTDVKAAIRYLKYNDAAIPGDAEKIVISGTSGGGALSVIISASGNSADYYESLYEIGAAGIVKNEDGTYTDTLSDDVWGTIAYCPITDLGNACAAYEWQWADARAYCLETGTLASGGMMAPSYEMGEELMAEATALLKANYEEYLDSLGLETVSAANLENTIIALMKAEIEESIEEIGIEQMKADLKGADWLVFNEDGTYTYDYEKHVNWVGSQTAFKAPSAFSNVGMSAWAGNMNEDDLFGTRTDAYSPFNEYSWNNDDTDNEVGKDDTGLTWDEYLATPAGEALALQIKMTNGIAYLLDAAGESDAAPNWYVRYGMADRDSSFAVEAVLNAAMDANADIENKSFEYAWLKGHAGDYDVVEAYAWLAERLDEEARANADAYLNIADATVSYLYPHIDGKEVAIKTYTDVYVAAPNRAVDQQIQICIPENATEDSPIIFLVNNSGWQSNAFSGHSGVVSYGTKEGRNGPQIVGDYNSETDNIGVALSRGYVVVSYGCRSRNNGQTDGEYLGHSPATMTDTKAAIRYLKLNDAAIPGDADKIVVSGTSGGGALSVIIAASGNSADYYESLYEVGAAGIVRNADGTYTDTLSDDVWGTIAYCPITDLGNACAAYDWTWGEARAAMMASGKLSYKGADAETVNANAAALTAIYEEYLDSLGLESVSSANLETTIIALMKAEIDESIKEYGIEQMKKDLGDATWLSFNEDGTYTYDFDAHRLWVAQQTALKISPAFSNVGTGYGEFMNEDNLFGARDQAYAPFNEYSWSIDATENNVGLDDTGLTWDQYMATPAGQALALQIKMTNPIPYLLDAEGESDSAPHWYVRYGMADRDSSFAVEAVLNAAIDANEDVENKSFEFAWLYGHKGNYDVPEAYAWLANELDAFSVEGAEETNTFDITVDGETVEITRYNDYYYSAAEGDTTSVGPGKYGPSGNRDDCQLSIYVPEGATADSAVMFLIENGSWAQTGFKEVIAAGQAFDSTQNDRVALALAHNMIVVSYGARCRGSVDAEGNYIHAPQMVVDTKAAIRYVKYNIEQGLIPGDADKVIVSGHSGGGAMSAIIAATGNSSDFDAYLKNAAPATDDVFAVMASAPITDLAYADFAYEWTFTDYRAEAPYDSLSYKSYDADLSAALAARYVKYIEDNFGMTEEEYAAKIAEIFAASVQHEIDLAGKYQFSDVRPETDERGWFELDENGDVASFDLDAYTKWAVQNAGITAAYSGNELKGVMAFNSEGMTGGYMRNENNLWGTPEQAYSVAYAELWDLVKDPAAIGVDKYDSFEEFWAAEGALVGMQMKMVSVMPYLTGSENMWYLEGLDDSGDESDVAPYWFIRHGMADIDTSYATVASLMLAVEENAEHVNAYFGWERAHNRHGSTYYIEFFEWLEDEGVIGEVGFKDVAADDWFADEVEFVVEEGLMNGKGDGKFAPYETASRAMVVTVLYRLAGSPAVEAEAEFTDLTADWYKDAVAWAVANGITKGTSDTTFEPDKAVTRQELATFLYRFSGAEAVEADLSKYEDADDIADWALEAMAWANAEGLITGKTETTLAPAETSNRAQLATILARYIA